MAGEAGIVVDHHLDLVAAHDIATEAHHRLLHDVQKLVDVTVHVSPSPHQGRTHHEILQHHPQPQGAPR